MKIRKIIKSKHGLYKVYFDDGNNYIFSDNLLLKYRLFENMDVDTAFLNKILKEDETNVAYNLVCEYVSNRLKTKRNVRNFLMRNGYPEIISEKICQRLEKEGIINDVYFASSYIKNLISNGKLITPLKICRDLSYKGVDKSIIFDILATIEDEYWKNTIRKLSEKKFPNRESKKNIEKNYYYLLNQGFRIDLINSYLSPIDRDNYYEY